MNQLGILLDIKGKEHSFIFEKRLYNDGFQWIGTNVKYEEVKVVIQEIDSTPVINNIEIHKLIETEKDVIFLRFQDGYTNFHQNIMDGIEPENDVLDWEEIQPYDPDKIKVRNDKYSVFEINRMITIENDIDLNPDFQRNLVWDKTKKSLLIESILLGIPLPVFYFSESKSGTYHVVDGLQRLSTITSYLNNEFKLKNLEHLKDVCEGKYYKPDSSKKISVSNSLDRKYTRRLEKAQLVVYIIENISPQKVKFDIFKRINTGGKPLNRQEVRNCMAENPVRHFLKRCVHSKEFCLQLGIA